MTYITFSEGFTSFTYPAGERHVRARDLAALRSVTVVEHHARNFDDIAEMITADAIMRRNNIVAEWFVPYFPFARHDRRIDEGDGLELSLALSMVADLDLVIADPHSDVAGVLPHIPQRSVVETMRSFGAFDTGESTDPVVVIPDAGAAKKVIEWSSGLDTVQALKTREPRTGKLAGFEVLAGDLAQRPCVIVDDICDGGGTFLGLAEQLRAHNAGPLTLIVTHGLFTKGVDVLADAFSRIYSFGPTNEVSLPVTTGPLTLLPFRVLYEKGIRR